MTVHLETDAIVLTALPHGEHGAVVRFLTAERGLVAGFVRGARSRRLRPVIAPANGVRLRLDGRSEGQLAQAAVELERSRAGLAHDGTGLAIAEWLTGLVACVLPEGHPYPRLAATLAAVLDVAEFGADAAERLTALARFEVMLLAELGFGLDLSACASTGVTDDLRYVSPKSGRAVSGAAGAPYAGRLFPLSPILVGGNGSTEDILDALAVTRHFIERDLIAGRRAEAVVAARERALRSTGPRAGGKPAARSEG